MRYRRCFAGIAAATWLAACGKDVGGPSLDSVAGHYVASSFATTQAGVTTNQLARGALIDLTLVAGRRTPGPAFVPAPETRRSRLVTRPLGAFVPALGS